jgi:hypothetical protein
MKGSFVALVLTLLALGAVRPAAADCNCSGDACNCSCNKGACCVCSCSSSECLCKCVQAGPKSVSIPAGTTVMSAAATLSTAIGEHLVVLAGDDQTIALDIRSTPWQALARLRMLPGVRIGGVVSVEAKVKPTLPAATQGVAIHELQNVPLSESISLCVSAAVGLENALESLSQISGYAFDVSGSPVPSFTLGSKGTVEELVSRLSTAAGVEISIVR